jgi:hypothetical protein
VLTPQGFYCPPPAFVNHDNPPSAPEVRGWRIQVSQGPAGVFATMYQLYQRRLPDSLVGAEGTLRRIRTGAVEYAEVELGSVQMSRLNCDHNTCALTWLLVEMVGGLSQNASCGGVEFDTDDVLEGPPIACVDLPMDPLW